MYMNSHRGRGERPGSTTRRNLLGADFGGADAAVDLPAAGTHAASWQLKWSPTASDDGLGAFETLEDDRAESHPGASPHIYATGNNWRFNMHTATGTAGSDSGAGSRPLCGGRPH